MGKVLCQVVGCGPAALGLPLAADRAGILSRLIESGIEFLDGADSPDALARQRFPYLINANSIADDFVAGISPAGSFAQALVGRSGQTLDTHRRGTVPLRLVGDFMNDLTRRVEAVLPGNLVYGAEVALMHRNPDGTWTARGRDGAAISTARYVVLATGAYEDLVASSARHGIPREKLIGSAQVMSGEFDAALRVLLRGGRIAILGGSHSGFATAELLLDRFGELIPEAGLTVVHRSLTLSFADLDEAESMSEHSLAGPEVCPESGIINRFHGLRHGPRELCLRAMRGHERRLRLCRNGSAEADATLAEADLVVHASGYLTRSVPLYDQWGQRIPVHADNVAVDGHCRVVTTTSDPVPGVFGLGLGYARTDVWGRKRNAVNIFHGTDADRIISQLFSAAGYA